MTSRTRSTYHADCLCGKPITSETRETTGQACGRLLVFEWGGALAVPGPKDENLFDPAGVTDGVQTKPAVVVVGEKPKAKGASA